MKLPFKSNLPKDFDIAKHYSPIKTEQEKEHLSQTFKEIAKQRDEIYTEKLHQGIAKRDKTYQAISNAKPEVQAKISVSLTGVKKTAEHKQNLKLTTTNKPGDKNWEQACQAGRNKRDKPFVCPFGVFNNRSSAIRYAKENNLFSNAQRKLENWTKENPKEYYYITHEEYILLTGREI
jgi:hypothetical protein